MATIKIISDCNAHCDYCFQNKKQDSKKNVIDFNDAVEALKWASDFSLVNITGGEPTLHPDIFKILEKASFLYKRQYIFSNLLLDPTLLRDIIYNFSDLIWMVNAATDSDKDDVFFENLSILSEKSYNPVSLGIVFGLNKKKNENIIEKIASLIKNNKNISNIRFAFENVCSDGFLGLNSFSDDVLKLCKTVNEINPSVAILSECYINFCNLSFTSVAVMLEKYKVRNLITSNFCRPILEIQPDRSVKYCHLAPDGFLSVDDFLKFSCSRECYDYLNEQLSKYIVKYNRVCDVSNKCTNEACMGPCPAICEYIRREKEGL